MGLSISQKSASPLDRLVRLVAAEKNPHQLISLVAADSALIDEVRRVCGNLQESEWAGRQEFRDLCRQHRVTPEYFEEKLWLIANILHLTEHEHDYYEILEVPRTASQREIKQAFRRLSLTSHPDVNPHDRDAVERFRELHRAYEVLSDHRLRRHYDQQTALTEWPAESSQAAQTQSSRSGWWRWRYIAQLAAVVGLLLAVSFLVDYQEWAADRYYRTKEKQRHEAAVSVPVREPGVGNDSSKASAPLAETASENRSDFTASSETLIASNRNEAPKVAPASAEVSEEVHGDEAKGTVEEQPVPSLTPATPATPAIKAQLEASPRKSQIEKPPKQPFQPQKVQESKGKAGPAQSAGESAGTVARARQTQERAGVNTQPDPLPGKQPARPEQIALLDPASPGKVLSVQFQEQHLSDFLNRYTKAYEKKELGTLMRFFEADALENGEPIASLVPLYQKNFQRAEMIHYQIQMTQYTAIENRVKIRGAFRLKSKLAGEHVRESAGSIQLTLTHEGNAFRIKRLDYQFANPSEPLSFKQ